MAAQGNWQAPGAQQINSESNDLFNIKNITAKNAKAPVVNTVTSGSTVTLKQPLSVTSASEDGTPLDTKLFTAGQCKVTKISKNFATLQDCFVDESGSVVYKFLVTGAKSTDSNLCHGVQTAASKGTGELLLGGSGLGQKTFLFQVSK